MIRSSLPCAVLYCELTQWLVEYRCFLDFDGSISILHSCKLQPEFCHPSEKPSHHLQPVAAVLSCQRDAGDENSQLVSAGTRVNGDMSVTPEELRRVPRTYHCAPLPPPRVSVDSAVSLTSDVGTAASEEPTYGNTTVSARRPGGDGRTPGAPPPQRHGH